MSGDEKSARVTIPCATAGIESGSIILPARCTRAYNRKPRPRPCPLYWQRRAPFHGAPHCCMKNLRATDNAYQHGIETLRNPYLKPMENDYIKTASEWHWRPPSFLPYFEVNPCTLSAVCVGRGRTLRYTLASCCFCNYHWFIFDIFRFKSNKLWIDYTNLFKKPVKNRKNTP